MGVIHHMKREERKGNFPFLGGEKKKGLIRKRNKEEKKRIFLEGRQA